MAKKKVQQPQNDITEFFDALAAYAAEKGIDKDVFAEKIKSAIEKSLKTSMHVEDKDSECVFVNIDFDRKIFNVSVLKEVIEVVDTLYEPEIEIVLEEARKLNPAAQVGDKIRVPSSSASQPRTRRISSSRDSATSSVSSSARCGASMRTRLYPRSLQRSNPRQAMQLLRSTTTKYC